MNIYPICRYTYVEAVELRYSFQTTGRGREKRDVCTEYSHNRRKDNTSVYNRLVPTYIDWYEDTRSRGGILSPIHGKDRTGVEGSRELVGRRRPVWKFNWALDYSSSFRELVYYILREWFLISMLYDNGTLWLTLNWIDFVIFPCSKGSILLNLFFITSWITAIFVSFQLQYV